MPIGAIPFPFGKCKICKDKATGVHYGVATCEGCKGFFKRSIPKAQKYKCFFGGQCEISPKNRNRCKSCRFKLCLHYGMSVDAVKMGRIPKTEKEKALAEAALDNGSDSSCSPLQHMPSPDTPQQAFQFGNQCPEKSKELHCGNQFMESAFAPFGAPTTSMTELPHVPMARRVPSMEQNVFTRTQSTEYLQHDDTVPRNITQNEFPWLQPLHSNDRDIYQAEASRHFSLFHQQGIGSPPTDGINVPSTPAFPLNVKSEVPSNSQSAHIPCQYSNNQLLPCEDANLQSQKNHFSSSVIDELVRHVLESSEMSVSMHERTSSILSSSSSVSSCQFQALSLSKNDQHLQSSSTHSNSTTECDPGKKEFNSRTFSCSSQNENIFQNGDERGSDSLLPSTSEEITEEETHDSISLIKNTLKRLEQPIKNLFSGQAHNKECLLKHKTGEEVLPMTATDKESIKEIWAELMSGVNKYNEQLMGFANKIPGFSNFKKSDQEKLTMNAYMEVWMMLNAEFMKDNESYVLLNDKEIFYSKATMTKILGEELTTLMLDFGKKFSQYELSDFEIGILCAVLLTNPEVENLEERDKAVVLNSHILDVFASVICKRPNSSRFALSLFQYMAVLKTISKLQVESIFNFQLEAPNDIENCKKTP